jgi:hypothetical protein
MKRLRRVLVAIAIILCIAYLLALAGMYLFQRNFQYDTGGRMFELAETGLTSSELVSIPAANGGTSVSRLVRATGCRASRPFSISAAIRRASRASMSATRPSSPTGYGYLAFDYRGFPGTPGEISEANILADCARCLRLAGAKGACRSCSGGARSAQAPPPTWRACAMPMRCCSRRPSIPRSRLLRERYGFLPVAVG